MEMLHNTDKIVRNYLPTMLYAAGYNNYACELLELDPMVDPFDIVTVAGRLSEYNVMIQNDSRQFALKQTVLDALFWTEAMIWAATKEDWMNFRNHIVRLGEVMRAGTTFNVMN